MARKPLERKLGRGLWTTVRLLPRVSPGATAVAGVLVLAAASLPVAFTIASGVLVGRVPAAVADGLDGPGGDALLRMLAVVAGLFVAQQVVAIVLEHLTDVLGRRLNGHLRDRVVAASLSPAEITHLEMPDVVDTMMLARNVAPGFYTPGSAVFGIIGGLGLRLQAVGSALVVATFSPLLAAGLLAAGAAGQTLLLRAFFRSIRLTMASDGGGRDHRRSVYFRDLALTPDAAKEVRVFGLRDWVGAQYATSWLAAVSGAWADRRRGQTGMLMSVLIGSGATLGGLLAVVSAALAGDIDLGRFAVLMGAVLGANMFLANDNDLRAAFGAEAVPAILDLERRLASTSDDPADPATHRPHVPVPVPVRREPVGLAPDQPRRSIRFDGVGFTYPTGERPVYEHLDLELHAGASTAVVGVNGAGKTTLVKLLARLYEPDAGRITVDGVDLAALDPVAWRAKLAILFQDYVRYALPAADNVGFGAVHLDDPGAVRRAAERAGALEIVDRLQDGWDTVLSRTVHGGADLSGGQWQRVALARALLAVDAGARVLVLDEPTANLDVRAEAEIYDRFLELTRGLTTVVISHRFSTVRRADRIVVIDGGRVVEDGTHDELVAAGGRYARMFAVQAARFADGDITNNSPDGTDAGAAGGDITNNSSDGTDAGAAGGDGDGGLVGSGASDA